MKKIHRYTVTISGCNAEQAAIVINNRINYDEDLGFGYDISHEPQAPIVDSVWVVDDGFLTQQDHIDRLTEDINSPERHWTAVGIEDIEGYAESVAYCHPCNAPVIAAAPSAIQLLQAILDEAPADWRESSLLAAQASKLLASLNS